MAEASNVTIGGTAAGEGNVIAYNGGWAGIAVVHSGITIRGNSIFDNPGDAPGNGLGIDLLTAGLGVTLNDAGDADTGPNGGQNFPVITSVTYGGASTTVAGTLNSTAATSFDLDFYADPVCSRRPQDLPEGKTYLGSVQVTTDGSGNAVFNEALPVAVPDGSPVTATATAPDGSTSEFTPRFVLSLTPRAGSPGGHSSAQIKGLSFVDGATVTVGGVPATGVVVNDANTIFANIPALPAGSINDLTVANPGGGLSGTLPNAWIASFNDVPPGQQFYDQVTKLVANGITAGVGGGIYGVAQNTLRQQMAVFLHEVEVRRLLRAARLHGRLRRRALLLGLRAVDRGPCGRGDHGRLRRGQLLPDQPRASGPDGGLPAQGQARLLLRAAGLQRGLR